MKHINTSSHDQFSLRYTNDRDVYFHHVVSRYGHYFLMNFGSLIESIIDVGSGFLLAVAIQIFIFPFFELYPSILDSIGIALIFTVISMLRSWVWRSYFRRRHEME